MHRVLLLLTLWLLGHHGILTSGCFETEREALLTFKAVIIDTGGRLSSWAGRDCCSWRGVVCDGNTGHVVKLNLQSKYQQYANWSYYALGGGIPKSFQNLCNLVSMDLSGLGIGGDIAELLGPAHCSRKNMELLMLGNNKLHGNLSSWLEEMKNLSDLDLNNNLLVGVIPTGIGGLSNLQWLDLSYNSLQGVISEAHFANLEKLEGLILSSNSLIIEVDHGWIPPFQLSEISNNKFTGEIPTWMGENMKDLVILQLRSNMFVGEIPSELAQLAYLQFLDLAHNNLTGSIPRSFGNFSAMIYDAIDNYDRNGYTIDEGNFTAFDYKNNLLVAIQGKYYHYSSTIYLLKIMDLSKNNLSGQIPEEIISLASLLSLNLSENHLTGKIPERLGDMRSLESLDLSLNELQGAIPQSLSDLTFLNHLNLSYNNLSGRIPTGNQLDTLDNTSIYIGNIYLCGPPTKKICSENGTMPNIIGDDCDGSKSTWLYLGMGLGFVAGFWGRLSYKVDLGELVAKLFQTWLEATFGQHPKAIITNQDLGMKKAIEQTTSRILKFVGSSVKALSSATLALQAVIKRTTDACIISSRLSVGLATTVGARHEALLVLALLMPTCLRSQISTVLGKELPRSSPDSISKVLSKELPRFLPDSISKVLDKELPRSLPDSISLY
ncbi:LRR receptor-like serine/threonine-protein kinase ERL2 [Ananas comosus]|uniref:LRR receptor-like serine/threonine-protein kinase ERL2 n=1 Tax=Ananas comosus TaxID=4615 RepID=A0A199VR04_ANACO|nr:LRR receptor-like serine/threonine-protein kinase ERL2 [Ananas comosus]